MLSASNSQKFKFWSFISMVLLVYVHGYNLNVNYLQPWTLPGEPLSMTGFLEYWLDNGIFRFRIPMLFIISGYLYALNDYRPYKQRTVKRVRTLLYPYLIWSAAGLLLTYLLESFTASRSVVVATHMMQIDSARGLLHQFHWYEAIACWLFFPVSYQLWFIRVLLIYNIAYPALRWCITRPIGKWIFFSFVFLLWISTTGLILFEGEGLLFFSLGVWMQKTDFNIDTPNKWLRPSIWFVVFIALSVTKTVMAFECDFKGIGFVLTLIHKLVIISGLITAWYGCNKLVTFFMNKKWFVWVSAFAFIIYVMHAPAVLYATKAIFMYVNHYFGYRLITFILLPSLLVVTAIFTGALLRKLMPKVYSFITGGRGLA